MSSNAVFLVTDGRSQDLVVQGMQAFEYPQAVLSERNIRFGNHVFLHSGNDFLAAAFHKVLGNTHADRQIREVEKGYEILWRVLAVYGVGVSGHSLFRPFVYDPPDPAALAIP